MQGSVGRSLLRVVAVLVGAILVASVFVSTERQRPASTLLGRAFGAEPVAPRLDAVADTIAVAHRSPSAEQLAFARRVAFAEPLNALPYYIFGATGPSDAVSRNRALVAMALRRDPRLRPAWSWTVTDRIAGKDTVGMTRALVRLAVLNPENRQLWPAIAQISADPVARAILKPQIAHGAPWRDVYLSALSASSVDRAVVFEMLQSAGRKPPVGALPTGQADDRRAFLAQLVARKDYESAYLAWVQWLPAASQSAVGYVFDGTFKGATALPPFAWAFTDGVGGATAIDPQSGLSIDYSGTDGAVVARQMTLLPAGRYRLVTEAAFAPVSNENGSAPLVWSLSCLPEGTTALSELTVPLDGTAKRAGGQPFDVPTTCAAQTLVLKVNSADFAKRLSGKIRSISVEAIK